MTTLSTLDKEQMLGKIVVLRPQSQDTENNSLNIFTLPRLVVDGLFMLDKPIPTPKKLSPLATGPYSAITTTGGLISPQSPARPAGRPIDPSLVMWLITKAGQLY